MGQPQYLRYPLSYRDIEGLLLERSLEVERSTVNCPIPAEELHRLSQLGDATT